MRNIDHEADVCVVGGGMAGLTAALAAARHGARTVLLQDRPVLGGNASSECRVHIQGADRHNQRPNLRETGLLEEIRLENLARNPTRSWGIWDTVLYERAALQDGLALLLNCTCLGAETDRGRVRTVTGWQLTTETRHRVAARVFIDASGDGILAPLTGAPFRIGREGRAEYGESHAPPEADAKTMGMSLLFQAADTGRPQPFEPLPWAYTFASCDEMPHGVRGHRHLRMGYWWVELGGENDSIHDAERLRHELLRVVYGIWDHIKNRCQERDRAATWTLEWVQFLPAKRESRRYVGAHVLTQNDVEAGGPFDDLVAYGGWTMDDHPPAGFWCTRHGAPPTIHHKTPSPFGIPYRSLRSAEVANLMAVGRCASASHMAMSSTRVMGTGCSMGQAAGTAAAMAAAAGTDPAALGHRIGALQQALLRDDAYLPGVPQAFGPLTRGARLAASSGDPAPLRDGVNRPVGDDPHAWPCRPGDHVEMTFERPEPVETVSAIVASGLDRNVIMSYHPGGGTELLTALPDDMPRDLRLDVLEGGAWHEAARVRDNRRRLVRLGLGRRVDGVRVAVERTWGAEATRLYALYVD